jgi:hypothetical protein
MGVRSGSPHLPCSTSAVAPKADAAASNGKRQLWGQKQSFRNANCARFIALDRSAEVRSAMSYQMKYRWSPVGVLARSRSSVCGRRRVADRTSQASAWGRSMCLGAAGGSAVPTSQGIIACCNEFGRRRNHQRMFVLICKIPMTLLSKARAPFGDAGSGSIERGGKRKRKQFVRCLFLAGSSAEVVHGRFPSSW